MTSAPTPARHDVRAGVAVRSAGIAVAVGLALGPAVALGLARFAYALLLPAMRDDLHWSFAAAGAMNTTNAIGYLAAPLARWGGTRAMFVGGLCVTAAALLACAATTNLAALRVARTLAGAAKAGSFVLGGGLAARAGAGRSQRTGL